MGPLIEWFFHFMSHYTSTPYKGDILLHDIFNNLLAKLYPPNICNIRFSISVNYSSRK